MGQLVFQATAGGQVALVGPNPSTNFSLNVPAVNSTLATLAAQTFTGQQTDTVDASISGLTVGKGSGSVSTNTTIGYQAGYNNTTGHDCTFVGYQAGNSNTTGNYNQFFGRLAGGGSAGITGSNNTGVGSASLYVVTSGASNCALGYATLSANTTGSFNNAMGDGALTANTTGSNNIALGYSALNANTTASYNTAVGYQAGYSNTTGAQNTYLGQQAGYGGTTAKNNTCIGLQAGYSLTTGSGNTFVGPYNDANGYAAGYFVTTGSKNTIIGNYAGNQGGLDIRTASNYIVLSDGDGNPRGYFDNNGVFYSTAGVTTGSGGGVSIGANSTNNTFYTSSLGSGSTTMYIGNKAITAVSDIRIKDNIKPTERNGLELLNQWQIIDHTWNDPSDTAPVNRNTRGTWVGVTAQQIVDSTPWLVNAPDKDCPKCKFGEHCEEHQSLWQVDFEYAVPLLVKAIQELNAKITALENK